MLTQDFGNLRDRRDSIRDRRNRRWKDERDPRGNVDDMLPNDPLLDDMRDMRNDPAFVERMRQRENERDRRGRERGRDRERERERERNRGDDYDPRDMIDANMDDELAMLGEQL